MTNEFMFSRRGFLAAFGSAVAYGATAGGVAKRRDGEILIAHCTDPQFGLGPPRAGKLMTEEGYAHDLDRCLSAIEIINALDPDLVCITGDMTQSGMDVARDWPRLLKMYHPPVVVAPGNHDVGNRVTASAVKRFQAVFGYDYTAVTVKGWRVISANSLYWWPNKEEALCAAHEKWFADELAGAKARGEKVIVATHVPPFVKDPDEADSHDNQPLAGRRARLDACLAAGAKFYLAGHTHRYAERMYGSLPILNAETTSVTGGGRPLGFRLLRIQPDGSYTYDFVRVDQGPAVPKQKFGIMSFNIRHGQGMDGQVDLERTAAAIKREKPRFAGLSEVDRRTKRTGGVNQAKTLATLTGMHSTFGRAIDLQGGQYGVALLSLDKPFGSRQVPLPGKEPRTLLLVEFPDCVVGVTHLSVSADKERRESVDLIKAAIAGEKKPVFLMGDWNARPKSDVLTAMRSFLTVVSDETGRTFHGRKVDGPAAEQEYCIDYIAIDSAHAPKWRVSSRKTVPDVITSDHKPIVAVIESVDAQR